MSKQNRAVEYDLLREMLLRTRDELSQHIEEWRQEIIMELEPEDAADAASRDASTGMAIVNMEREMRMLAEIDLSLRRMNAGHYGACGVCGEQVPLARLQAIPWTRYCGDCAGGPQAERQEPQSTQNDSTNLSATRR
jgi:DnaK suppressor protein